MPELANIPTQEFKTRALMVLDRAANPWFKKRYVIITEDEDYGGGLTLSIFTNNTLVLIHAENEVQVTGLPPGGTTGQMLVKNSDADFDAIWIDVPSFSVETFDLLIKPTTKLLIKPGVALKI